MRREIWRPRIAATVAGVLSVAVMACRDMPTDPRSVDATVLAAANTATDPMSKVNRLKPQLEQRVQTLRAGLEADGWETARGYWTLWGVDDCMYPRQTVGFCYGNNPTAPYVTAVVPQWKDEFVDQSLHHAIMAAERNMLPNYRLSEREALVIVAEMPPPARYFGIQSNVFTRETTLNTDDIIFPRIPDPLLQSILFATAPNPSRMMLIASIGDAINNVTIDEQTGESWQAGQQRYFVITPDQGTADAMTQALLDAGVASENQIFVERVSPALVHLGLGRSADDLITYIRYAMPEDSVLGEQWRKQLPLTILRVRPKTNSAAPDPFAIPSYEAKTWNFDETVLSAERYALIDAVRAYWNQPDADTASFFSAYRFLDLIGQHCLGYPDPARGPMNCLGDTQDADYQISQSNLLDDNKVVAVVGTLGTVTNNATYVSLSVNWFPALVGVKNISDEDLEGSADAFAEGVLTSDSRMFYVYYVARDCTGLQYCVEIPRRLVPSGELIKIIQRNYVTPGGHRGSNPLKILNPIAIALDGTMRP